MATEHTDSLLVRGKLHNQLGNAIGEHKKKMFDRLRKGSDLEDAMACFFCELSLSFDEITAEWKLKT